MVVIVPLSIQECANYPRMCQSSLRDKVCLDNKPGSRCRRGYHLRGTKFGDKKSDPVVGNNDSQVNTGSNSNSKEIDTLRKEVSGIKDFLEKSLKHQLKEMLQEMGVLKQVRKEVPLERKERRKELLKALWEEED